jgi:DNA-binding transcriptional LysR family regulator
MQVQNLRYFDCVASTGSFSKAADLMHRSQPALSRAIQEM